LAVPAAAHAKRLNNESGKYLFAEIVWSRRFDALFADARKSASSRFNESGRSP